LKEGGDAAVEARIRRRSLQLFIGWGGVEERELAMTVCVYCDK